MYRLMIVDDDKLARDVIQHSVNWSEMGITSIEVATDGQDALDKCVQFQPNVLITDIRMPNMDGLELVKKLVELCPAVRTIIISGYGEFDYARKAVQYGTSDYLLKPFSVEELTDSVRLVISSLRQSENEFQKHAILSRESLVRELLEGRYRPLIDHSVAAYYFGKDWNMKAGWRVSILKLDDFTQFLNSHQSSERNRFEFSVSNIMNELLMNYNCIAFCSLDAGEWASIMLDENDNDTYKDILGDIQYKIRQHLAITVSIAVSERLSSVEMIPLGLQQSKELHRYRSSLGCNRIIEKKDVRHLSMVPSIDRDVVEFKNSKNKSTNLYITKAMEIMKQRYKENLSLTSVAVELMITPNYLSNLFKQEIDTTFLETLTEVRLNIAKDLLKQPLLKNYEIAEQVGYNSSEYFTKVFKKYTGANPTDFRRT